MLVDHKAEGLVPKLKVFDGDLPDCISLCREGKRPIELLLVAVNAMRAEEEDKLKDALSMTKTVRRLALIDERLDTPVNWGWPGPAFGLSTETLRTILTACPKLTHFQSIMDVTASRVSVVRELFILL